MEAKDLLRAAQAGDPDARETLARTWLRPVYAVALAVTGVRSDAEDVTQETFLRAFRSLSKLREPDRLGAWLAQIARNAARDVLRRRPRRPDALVSDVAATVPSAEAVPPGWDALPEEERLVCWLHVCNEMAFRDIARLLDHSKSHVYRIYRKGIDTLRRVGALQESVTTWSNEVATQEAVTRKAK